MRKSKIKIKRMELFFLGLYLYYSTVHSILPECRRLHPLNPWTGISDVIKGFRGTLFFTKRLLLIYSWFISRVNDRKKNAPENSNRHLFYSTFFFFFFFFFFDFILFIDLCFTYCIFSVTFGYVYKRDIENT